MVCAGLWFVMVCVGLWWFVVWGGQYCGYNCMWAAGLEDGALDDGDPSMDTGLASMARLIMWIHLWTPASAVTETSRSNGSAWIR